MKISESANRSTFFAREWHYFYVERLKRNRGNRSRASLCLGGGGKKKMCSRFIGNTVRDIVCKLVEWKTQKKLLFKTAKIFYSSFFSFFLRFNFQDIGQIREITLQTRGIRLNLI